jgi:hypothetical protein
MAGMGKIHSAQTLCPMSYQGKNTGFFDNTASGRSFVNMTRFLLMNILLFLSFQLVAQDRTISTGKLFWKEDFTAGKLPDGWINKAVNDSSIVWECTDQPFPGSYGRDQQAPPIASVSGGFHMQFAPGARVDRLYRKWEKAGIWPDAYFETVPVDCSTKNSVVLTFQQNFMWNDWGKVHKDGGLYVGVSNNGTDWKEYEVRNGIATEADCPNPMNVELNITEVAAFQNTVFLRFLNWTLLLITMLLKKSCNEYI